MMQTFSLARARCWLLGYFGELKNSRSSSESESGGDTDTPTSWLILRGRGGGADLGARRATVDIGGLADCRPWSGAGTMSVASFRSAAKNDSSAASPVSSPTTSASPVLRALVAVSAGRNAAVTATVTAILLSASRSLASRPCKAETSSDFGTMVRSRGLPPSPSTYMSGRGTNTYLFLRWWGREEQFGGDHQCLATVDLQQECHMVRPRVLGAYPGVSSTITVYGVGVDTHCMSASRDAHPSGHRHSFVAVAQSCTAVGTGRTRHTGCDTIAVTAGGGWRV